MQQMIKTSELKTHKRNSELSKLEAEQKEGLKHLIEIHGFTEAIEITKDYVLLDGHNRVAIAQELGIEEVPFRIVEIDKDYEFDYIVEKNSSRRQMTKEQIAYLRGKKYEALKNQKSGGKTSDIIAKQDKVSEKTVRRDAKFAKNIDEATKDVPTAKEKILNQDIISTKEDLNEIVKLEEDQIKLVMEDAEKRGNLKDALKDSKLVPLEIIYPENVVLVEKMKVDLKKIEDRINKKRKDIEDQRKVHEAFQEFIAKMEKLLD